MKERENEKRLLHRLDLPRLPQGYPAEDDATAAIAAGILYAIEEMTDLRREIAAARGDLAEMRREAWS